MRDLAEVFAAIKAYERAATKRFMELVFDDMAQRAVEGRR